MDIDTYIHGVADGAPWIHEQYKKQFGLSHDFYIDFYHVSEYLGAASKELSKTNLLGDQKSSEWFKECKLKLKNGKSEEVIEELRNLLESTESNFSSELSKAYHYLANRSECLNYDKALAQDLPIGSGEVESGHRSVLQARLKKPGAWWRIDHAENMAHLKVLQANGEWEDFWAQQAA